MIPGLNEYKGEAAKNSGNNETREFELVTVDDLIRNAKPTEWLINGILNADSLSVLFGPPGCGKSFLSLDLGLSIAAGIDWLGHRVKQAPVIMIIGEGHNGYAKRCAAWFKHNGIDPDNVPFAISKVPMQMLDDDSAQAVREAVEDFSAIHGKVGMVCIDTLARNFGPGDENNTSDMTRFVSNCDKYLDSGLNRLIVHHTGHGNVERARGSSVLLGAVDSEFKLSKKDGVITLTNTKMKDDPEFDPIFLKPIPVMLGGKFGDLETSVVLVPTKEAKPNIKLTQKQKEALILLKLLEKDKVTAGGKQVSPCKKDWRAFCIEEKVYTETSFYAAMDNLHEKNIIMISGDYVSFSPDSPTFTLD